jgi:TonB family protein
MSMPATITQPDWARRPTYAESAEYYPKAAQDQGLEGRARIACAVTGDGSLQRCTVVEETPPGAGFGQASLSMAPLFRMRPLTVDGRSVEGGNVIIPIRFVLPQQERPPEGVLVGAAAVLLCVVAALAAAAFLLLARFGRRDDGRAAGRSAPSGERPRFFLNPSLAQVWDIFAARFVPDGDGAYVFRARLTAPGYRFDAEARNRMVSDFGRRMVWLTWGSAALVMLACIAWVAAADGREATPVVILLIVVLSGALFLLFYGLIWNAPLRELEGKVSIDQGHTREYARDVHLKQLTWPRLGLGAAMIPLMLLYVGRDANLLVGWNRLWLLAAAALACLLAVQAVRKLRHDRRS